MILQGRNLTQNLTGADVGELQSELSKLGFTVPSTEQTATQFGTGTLAAVQQFQAAAGLTANGVVDQATAEAMTTVIANSTYNVSGTISSSMTPRVGVLTVQLLDQNVGGPTTLSTTRCNADGSYAFKNLVVSATYLKQHTKQRPDLQVDVLGGTTVLASSAVEYAAGLTSTINVTLPESATGLPSEYESLASGIQSVYVGSVANLQENATQQDVTYLANRSNWDPRSVAMLSLAAQFATISVPGAAPAPGAAANNPTVSLQPEFYYALFRAGIPSDPDTLFQTGTASVQAIWQQALAQNVIPQSLSSSVAGAVQTFQTLSAAHTLTMAPAVGLSKLQDLIAPALSTAAQQQQFTQLLAQHRDDWSNLWTAVQSALGATASTQLQLLGKLYYMTVNNAPLVAALNKAESQTPLSAPSDLATRGYYNASKWTPLIGSSIPPGVPGATAAEQAANYAELLAAQVRVSFPTAVLADKIKSNVIPLADTPAIQSEVATFLAANQAQFGIGSEPVDAFLARTKTTAPSSQARQQIKRLQRAYQLTPDDAGMAVMLRHNLDSAYAITRYDSAGFARAFASDLGGTAQAHAVHARAKHIFAAVLNVATAYAGARIAPSLGGSVPVLHGFTPPGATPTPAGATLEELFGSLDYCNCSDCSSILSPAAYLVDLLHYIDQPSPTPGYTNPQSVLFSRRPDLQYLPLTCENTNTALPYIDVVNETLEYFVANGLSLQNYQGHDTGDAVTSAELLASPQYVNDAAYATLQQSFFPAPLPFNRPLELLRQHLSALGVALPDAMIALRPNDRMTNLPGDNPLNPPTGYGWSDILLEQLGISRDEGRIFSDTTLHLGDLYGIAKAANQTPVQWDATVLAALQGMNLQQLCQRLAISYTDLVAILGTQFVNPNANLIPWVAPLNAPFATLAALKANLNTPQTIVPEFIAALPAGLDATPYGGATPNDYQAVVNWLTSPSIYPSIMSLITIANPTGAPDDCSGTALQLRYSNPATPNVLSATDYLKLIRFVRLWQKLMPVLGDSSDTVTISQTDAILAALYPPSKLPQQSSSASNDASNRPLLDAGFSVLLPRTGFLFRALNMLSLTADAGLFQLLACFAPIGTIGANSLYQRMFLTPTMLAQDPGAQTATVSPAINAGDVLTTSINGVSIAHTVASGETAAAAATAIAAAINAATTKDPVSQSPLNQRFVATAQGPIVAIKAGFSASCSIGGAKTESVAVTAVNPTSQSLAISGTLTPGDVLTTTIDGVPVVYTISATDTLAGAAQNVAAAINSTTAAHPYSGLPLNNIVAASAPAAKPGTVALIAPNAGAPFTLTCAITLASAGTYVAGPPIAASYTATVGGTIKSGDTMTTSINGTAIAYKVAAGDTTTAALAASLAKAIGGATALDPATSLPIGSLVKAKAANNVITITATDPATSFTMSTSASGSETYTTSGPTPASETATVGGAIPAGSLLTTTVNGLPLYYTVQSNDTTATIASNVAKAIATTTQPDPVSNLPLPSVLSATAAGNVVTVTARNVTTPFTLAVSLSQGSYTAGRLTPPFAANSVGAYLADASQTLFGHEPLLSAACNLTGAEFAQIAQQWGFDASTPLLLANVSQLFRCGWLAHAMNLSVLEFLYLREFSGLDPFATLDPANAAPVDPPIVRFIAMLAAIRTAGLQPVQALYFMWNQDVSGTSSPPKSDITGLAFTLRADFAAVESQFQMQDDPDGSIAQGLMALVYGADATTFFFGLLNGTFSSSVPYSYASPALPQGVIDASGGLLRYDNLNKLLSFAGVLSSATQNAIGAAAAVNTTDSTDNLAAGSITMTPGAMSNIQPGTALRIDSGAGAETVVVNAVTATSFSTTTVQAHNGASTAFPIVNDPGFTAALAALAAANAQTVAPFFATYPELLPLFTAYVSSSDPLQIRRTLLLNNFLPTLKRIRKEEQALASVTSAVGSDPSFANALLQDPAILHADVDPTAAAVTDLTAIGNGGLLAQFYLSNAITPAPDQSTDTASPLSYVPTAAISGTPAAGMVLTTTINGVAIPYIATQADVSAAILAGNVAAAINAATALDAKSGLPINRLVAATLLPAVAGAPATIAIASQTPAAANGLITLACSVTGSGLQYVAGSQLPAGKANAPIAATWSGYLDVPQSGSYNFAVVADTGAQVSLSIDGENVPMNLVGGVFTNQMQVTLTASALVPILLTATSVKTTLTLSWQSPPGIGWEAIPGDFLYSQSLVQRMDDTYVRFLKATSLAGGLSMDADEIAYLGTDRTAVVETTCATAAAAGAVTFTPRAMTNIAVGSALVIDTGTLQETINVTAVTATTFTATATKAHDGTVTPFYVVSAASPDVSRGWLNFLPGTPNQNSVGGAPANAAIALRLRDVLASLLDFARIKQALSPSDERLMQLLQNPSNVLPNGQTALVSLTGWSQGSINALMTQFFGNTAASNIGTVEGFRRLYDAYQLVAKCRISASTLVAAVTNAPTPTAVNALQSALRALYAESDWLTIVRPINDAMRIKQRDALVAYILQGCSQSTVLNAIKTADQLFEYFLIDAETQPPVDTSRIRLALSSVQLFIERLVRNLEPLVYPNDIDSAQWEWMKRYRVWQANREVFLWPENWLYPELRDDQSEIFQSTMSALMQSDITDDAASEAYLDYLTGLEGVAKLEPCGLYYLPSTPDTDETCYLIARTAGAKRTYYFRTLQGGSWAPWTEVKIECEDMPLTPIVWQTTDGNRLLLFWLKILKTSPVQPANLQGPSESVTSQQLNGASIGQLTQAGPSTMGALQQVRVNAVLCWSEYYNGKWQPTKTSDTNRPTWLGDFDPTGNNSFEAIRGLIRIEPAQYTGQNTALTSHGITFEVPAGSLILQIVWNGVKSAVPGFVLHNTHSLPIPFDDITWRVLQRTGKVSRMRNVELGSLLDLPVPERQFWPIQPYRGGPSDGTFSVAYYDTLAHINANAPPYNPKILGYNWQPRIVDTQLGLPNAWDAPFMYEDRRHIFYVVTTKDYQPFELYQGFGTIFGIGSLTKILPTLPPLVISQAYTGAAKTVALSGASPIVYQGQSIGANIGKAVNLGSILHEEVL